MAITLDQNLGTNTGSALASTITLTTAQTAAAGSRIIVAVCYETTATVTVTGGGLVWVSDKAVAGSTIKTTLVSADAPAGLASGTVLTATFSPNTDDRMIMGASFLGIVGGISGYVDTTGGADHGAVAAWTSGNMITTGGSLIFACGGGGGFVGGTTNAPTAPSLELHDIADGAGGNAASEYRIEPAAGTYVVAGTFSNAANFHLVSAAVAYKAAPSISSLASDTPFPPLGRGASW